MYLADTNIFLEILLKQEKSEVCKRFLVENIERIYISDFSLHSIGVILFRQKAEQVFSKFIADILPKVNLLTLPKNIYSDLVNIKKETGLDFDDSYQYCVCKCFKLKLLTLDKDFEKVKDVEIKFL